jgi:iron-regulated transporter 1
MGILEGLSASGNMLSIERDWIVTAASPNGQPYDLTHLNSSMRRIDLICKLIAPIATSLVISMAHIRIGVVIVNIMSVISWGSRVLVCTRSLVPESKITGSEDSGKS